MKQLIRAMNSKDIATAADEWRRELKLMLLVVIALALFFAIMIIDTTFVRPRTVFSDKDVQLLEQERERIMESTSSFGQWRHKMTLVKRHSGGFVSAKFSSGGRQPPVPLMINALNANGWRLYSPTLKDADATLCKGKYRVYLIWVGQKTLLSVHFTVKEFEKDPDC